MYLIVFFNHFVEGRLVGVDVKPVQHFAKLFSVDGAAAVLVKVLESLAEVKWPAVALRLNLQ